MTIRIDNVTALGTGVLGSQIAYQTAYSGFDVVAYDINDKSLDAARKAIEGLTARYEREVEGASDGRARTALGRIRYSSNLADAVRNADLVIESAPERPDVKKDLYAKLGPLAPEKFHVERLFAGQVGVTVMARFIAEQEKVHSYLIGLHVQSGDWIAEHTVRIFAAGLASRSAGVEEAAGRAVGLIAAGIRVQAYTLAFIDAFHLMAWMAVVMLILLATLGRFPLNFRDLAALDVSGRETRTGDQS
jgi:hypothetical protein